MCLCSLFISWLVSIASRAGILRALSCIPHPLLLKWAVKLSFFSWTWCLKLSTHKETRGKWKLVFLSAHIRSKAKKPWDTGYCISLLNIYISRKAQTISCYLFSSGRGCKPRKTSSSLYLWVACMLASVLSDFNKTNY